MKPCRKVSNEPTSWRRTAILPALRLAPRHRRSQAARGHDSARAGTLRARIKRLGRRSSTARDCLRIRHRCQPESDCTRARARPPLLSLAVGCRDPRTGAATVASCHSANAGMKGQRRVASSRPPLARGQRTLSVGSLTHLSSQMVARSWLMKWLGLIFQPFT
jgi:hypothetical protein